MESLPPVPRPSSTPIVDELDGDLFRIQTTFFVPPLSPHDDGIYVVAVGMVKTTSSKLIVNLLKTANRLELKQQEIDQLNSGFDPHLEQISADFEELTFLRALSQTAGSCDLLNPNTLAQQVVKDLCHLVKADAAAFLHAVVDKSPTNEKSVRVGEPLVYFGRQLMNAAQLASLIEKVQPELTNSDPVVRNHLDRDSEFRDFVGLKSCIQIPVSYQGNWYGWIVAYNRIPWSERAFGPRSSASVTLNDDEFGTNEAGLMNTAAITLAAHYHTLELFREKELLLIGVVRALINAIDAKDSYTCGHSDRVAVIAKYIGSRLDLGEQSCERLYLSGLLHDLGKIGIPDQVLSKPGKLTDEEFAIIQKHPEIGYRILSHLPQLRDVLPGVLHHHESVDGKGYPAGLKAEEIPLFARILAVADSYDAMTSMRPYRPGMCPEKAKSILAGGAGTQWDAEIVKAFIDAWSGIDDVLNASGKRHEALLNPGSQSAMMSHEGHSDAVAFAINGMHAS